MLNWPSSTFRVTDEDPPGCSFVKNSATAHMRLCAMAAGRHMVTRSAEPGLRGTILPDLSYEEGL